MVAVIQSNGSSITDEYITLCCVETILYVLPESMLVIELPDKWPNHSQFTMPISNMSSCVNYGKAVPTLALKTQFHRCLLYKCKKKKHSFAFYNAPQLILIVFLPFQPSGWSGSRLHFPHKDPVWPPESSGACRL